MICGVTGKLNTAEPTDPQTPLPSTVDETPRAFFIITSQNCLALAGGSISHLYFYRAQILCSFFHLGLFGKMWVVHMKP